MTQINLTLFETVATFKALYRINSICVLNPLYVSTYWWDLLKFIVVVINFCLLNKLMDDVFIC